MGCQQTGYRQVHHTSKLTPPYKKFTAEISNTEATFLDTAVYIRKRSQNQSTLDVKTHFKPTETFQCNHFSFCSPPGVKKKDSLRLLRTNSSKTTFEENIYIFNPHLLARGYPKRLIEKHQIHRRRISAETKNEDPKDILPFVTHLKNVLLEKWHLIQNRPPLISFKRRKSFNDVLVRLKL